MEWLWIILRYLFPLDPVRQCIAALCDRVAVMIKIALDDDALDDLAADPEARIALEAALIDYEATLRLTISARAHQIARLRFVPGKKAFHRPTSARSLVDLVKRIQILAKNCADIERLAQLQAIRLLSARDADPLSVLTLKPSLRDSPLPPSLRFGATSRHDAARRATSPGFAGGGQSQSSTGKAGGGGSPRLRGETEGAAQRAAAARAPPVFDVYLLPQPASQASPARSHPVAPQP